MVEMPNLTSSMSWSELPSLSTGTLHAWKSAMPEGPLLETPPTFRLPLISPSTTHRKTTLPMSKRLARELTNPSRNFTNLIDQKIQEARGLIASLATTLRPEDQEMQSKLPPESTTEAHNGGKIA